MADYIYTMETRLTPEQLSGAGMVQDVARAHEFNIYLTGGAVRDLISGLPIRDLDFTIQGNPLKLQKSLEQAGASIQGVEDGLKILYVLLPGNVRAEIGMARSETYDKPGKPPVVSPATITEDLRRRDFTVNAMALSLNPGSRGLLLDPANGVADIEAKLIRILHNYAFYEEPSRLIRATRYSARFHWPLEERTQARYDAAKENNYIEYLSQRAIGIEIEQLAYEEDPLHIMRALEKEGWLQVLNAHWSSAKVDTAGLTQLTKLKQQMYDLGYMPNAAPAVLYFLTRRLPEKDGTELAKLIPRRDLVESWASLESDAKELVKRLSGKEAATPSRTWHLLSAAKPETILFTLVTAKPQPVLQKINNFLGKWRQIKQKLPLPEMAELRITTALPTYPQIAEQAFLLMLDGKLRSRTEILKFLKPFSPPPPPPPPPPRRGKGAKAEVAGSTPGGARKKKGKAAAASAVVAAVPAAALEKAPEKAPEKAAKKTEKSEKAPAEKKTAANKAPAKPPAKKAPADKSKR